MNEVFAQIKNFKGDIKDVQVVCSLDQYTEAHRPSTMAIPHIVQWKPNHLIIAYEEGIPGKTDMADIVSLASKDDGNSWDGMTYIFNHREKCGNMQFAYANPILFKPDGQNLIWCFAMRNPLFQPNSEESFLVAAYSGDGGKSWHEVELIMHYSGSLVLAGNIQCVIENGEPVYLLPAHRNSIDNGPVGGARVQFLLRSKNLLEWDVSGYIPQPDSVWIHEGHLAHGDKDNELLMVMRTATMDNKQLNRPRAWSSRSVDNGRTWSFPKEEPDLWNSVSEAAFGKTNEGIYYYVYNDGPAFSRMALKYKIKLPNSEWSEERTFFDAGIKNSYPSIIEIAPGELRVVWDGGSEIRGRTKILFGKIKITKSAQNN